MKEKPIKDQCHDESMAQKFSSDPNYLASLVEAVLLDGAEGEVEILRRQSKLHWEYVIQKGAKANPLRRSLSKAACSFGGSSSVFWVGYRHLSRFESQKCRHF